MGLLKDCAYEQSEASLAPGDLLVIYTDGFSEAMNPDLTEWGEERLLESIVGCAGLPARGVRNARALQLVISENPEKIPLYKLDLNDPAAPRKPDEKKPAALLGPPIILTRGEPVNIEIKNQSINPTAIHWYGIELESYFDGVPGWSGSGQQITPPIAPGASFVAHITPTRAGTFISRRVIAKDDANLPPEQIVASQADMFLTVGATSDVEVMLEKSGPMGLQISKRQSREDGRSLRGNQGTTRRHSRP